MHSQTVRICIAGLCIVCDCRLVISVINSTFPSTWLPPPLLTGRLSCCSSSSLVSELLSLSSTSGDRCIDPRLMLARKEWLVVKTKKKLCPLNVSYRSIDVSKNEWNNSALQSWYCSSERREPGVGSSILFCCWSCLRCACSCSPGLGLHWRGWLGLGFRKGQCLYPQLLGAEQKNKNRYTDTQKVTLSIYYALLHIQNWKHPAGSIMVSQCGYVDT